MDDPRFTPEPELDVQEILRAIRRLQGNLPPEPLPLAPSELWPGESLDPQDPGRFLLANASPMDRLVRARLGGASRRKKRPSVPTV